VVEQILCNTALLHTYIAQTSTLSPPKRLFLAKKLFGVNELKTVHTINVIIVVVCQKDEQFSWEFINNLGKLFRTRVGKLREKELFHQAKQRSR
jgi:hypothetical protein